MARASIFLTLATLVCGAVPASAQIREPGRPVSESADLAADIPTHTLARPDVEAYMAEDDARGHWPYRFGAAVQVRQDAQSVGLWEEVPGSGALVWRLRIASPGALNIGIAFDEYELPSGAKLFLYNDDHSHVLGAYTARNNKPNGKFAIEAILGDAVTLEYVQEPWVTATPKLVVGEVVHGYRDIYPDVDLAQANNLPTNPVGLCFVDINCPEGDPYQVIKRSVVWGTASGTGCSASILNNTAQDGTPYLFYADHCGDFTNGVFLFNYELPGCGTGSAPTNQSLSGATFLAASGTYDSRLYVLTQVPPPSYTPYFAGWDHGNSQTGPGVSISHPLGEPKKIAIDDSGPTASGQFWRVRWDVGIVSFGSSGSPLFNGDQRVIGPACCVDNFNCGQQNVFYGRLDAFWNTGNLAQWLDPTGSGAIAIDGYDPCASISTYCTAKTNSCGSTPAISGVGTPSASESSGFVLEGSNSNFAKAGLVLYTPSGPAALPFQGGFLCVNPAGLERGALVVASGGASGTCTSTFEIDWNAFASGNLGGNPAAFLQSVGQVVNTQWWGRDTVAAGSYLTGGLEYTVCL